jgi:hypothetical protein
MASSVAEDWSRVGRAAAAADVLRESLGARWAARLAQAEAEAESSRADAAACGVRAVAAERAAAEHERAGTIAAAEARELRARLSAAQAHAEHEAARAAVAERALEQAEARRAAAEGEKREEGERARHAEVEAETAREAFHRLSGGASRGSLALSPAERAAATAKHRQLHAGRDGDGLGTGWQPEEARRESGGEELKYAPMRR